MKVRLCLAEKGLSWETRFIDLIKLDHMTPQYLELNPNGVVPTLVHDGSTAHIFKMPIFVIRARCFRSTPVNGGHLTNSTRFQVVRNGGLSPN
jgi:hypothetical protein